MLRARIKAFALKHKRLLAAYRASFGKLKTHYFFDIQRKSLQKNGLTLINNISSVLDKAGADFFIDCGSLLGLVRDNGLMAYDRDVDFGIRFDDKFTLQMLDEAMASIGLRKYKQFLFRGEVKEVTYGNGITSVDFFKHEETEGHSNLYVFYRKPDISYPSYDHYTTLIMHRAPIRCTKELSIRGIKVRIPENVEDYLESAYSDAWQTPDPTWSYLQEPGLEEVSGEFGFCQH